MAYNITSLKADLTGVLHGTTNNQITGIDNLINRAARTVLLDVDPQETKRTALFSSPIFNSVNQYAIAADVKGNKLIDIRPQVSRIPRDLWSQAYNQAFDIAKGNIFATPNMFTMNFDTGVKTILINAPYLSAPVILNQVESITSNGTWAAGGTASNLAVDNVNFVSGSGSLSFDVTSGAAYIENSTMSQLDLTTALNQSSLFAWVYIPTGATLTSVNLRWGSDSSNYYTATVTTNQEGNAFNNGWNLCQFVWSTASTTGSPSITAMDYLRVTLNVTGTMTACRVNLVESIMGQYLEYEYYSKYMFRDSSTGAFQETVTDDSNLVNLDTESYNLLFNQVAYLATQQQQGLDAAFYDGNFFGQAYQTALARYKAMYKSELQKPQSTYYGMPGKGYRKYIGRRYN